MLFRSVFIPDRIVSGLLGLGDIAGLAEKTSTIFDEKKAKEVRKSPHIKG